MRRVQSWSAITDVLQAAEPGTPDVLAALAVVAVLRSDLDRAERQLIDLAREGGASWQQVAAALGLRSRQAAEQRWLRLSGTAGRDVAEARRERLRQHSIDNSAGEQITALRAAVRALYDRLDPLDRDPAVSLARRTLAAALQAPPGALFDLARHAVDDLGGVPAQVLGRPAAAALDRVRGLTAPPGSAET